MTTASKVPPPTTQPPSRPPVQPRRPPNKPDSPPVDPSTTGRLAAELDTADLLLRTVGVLSLPGMDPAARMQLAYGLRTARRAVDGSKTPVRQPLSSAAAVAGGRSSHPLRAGECLTPGYAVALCGAASGSAGSVVDPGAGAISGCPQPDRAGSLPAPGAGDLAQQIGEAFGFRLPRDVRRH